MKKLLDFFSGKFDWFNRGMSGWKFGSHTKIVSRLLSNLNFF